ncbi:peptidoglycan bridge formation glycyltransferase FemA/FemB family protein [Halarcobacter sp.]|uniref:peptidoglycan bridge formation glycyltransferase FemA/FemB family protein n=1 Tax=Halarcobacter sp. TaxID=2321133 RepID=UPI003A90A20B
MKIEILNEKLHLEYEDFIKKFEGGLFFYSLKYKNFLEELLECESSYYIVVEEDKILAVYPMMQKKGKPGIVYNSLPFYGSHGGILSISDNATNMLIKKINEISSLDNTALNMYVSNLFENYNSDEVFIYDIKDNRIGQITPIKFNENIEENLMESFHYKTRNMIRKAQKSNIEVFIDNNAFEFLEITHKENMEAIGGKAKSSKFFKLIKKYFEASLDYDIYVAEKDGIFVSAMLVFYYNNIVEYFTPVVKVEYRSFQPLSLLIFQAMVDNANKKFKWWNWGGTWLSQDGVYRFKSRFGAIDKEYNYFIKVNNQDIYNFTKENLLSEYENFYTIPFEKLENR